MKTLILLLSVLCSTSYAQVYGNEPKVEQHLAQDLNWINNAACECPTPPHAQCTENMKKAMKNLEANHGNPEELPEAKQIDLMEYMIRGMQCPDSYMAAVMRLDLAKSRKEMAGTYSEGSPMLYESDVMGLGRLMCQCEAAKEHDDPNANLLCERKDIYQQFLDAYYGPVHMRSGMYQKTHFMALISSLENCAAEGVQPILSNLKRSAKSMK